MFVSDDVLCFHSVEFLGPQFRLLEFGTSLLATPIIIIVFYVYRTVSTVLASVVR